MVYLHTWKFIPLCSLPHFSRGRYLLSRGSDNAMHVRVGCAARHSCHAGQYTTAGFLDEGPAFYKGRLPLPIET